jgi:hypothetical protein
MIRAASRLAVAAALLSACAHAPLDGPPLAVRLELIDQAAVDFDAPALVERAVRRRIQARPELALSGDGSAPVLQIWLRSIRNDLLPGADPRLRAPRYRVAVELSAEVLLPADARKPMTASAVGESVYVARPGEIGRLDGAFRTFLARAAEEAADRIVDLIAAKYRRFNSRGP